MLIRQSDVDAALNNIMSQPNFSECIKLARKAAGDGKLYLAGGKLYRSLIEVIYGTDAKSNKCDFDFITTSIHAVDLKDGWQLNLKKGKEPYVDANGNQRSSHFINEEYGSEMDIVYIPTIIQVKEGELPNSIDGYFASVPLDIQAIAVDTDTAELLGQVGQLAILERLVKVNNKRSLKDYCDFKYMNYEAYIRKKAESVNFAYHFDKNMFRNDKMAEPATFRLFDNSFNINISNITTTPF